MENLGDKTLLICIQAEANNMRSKRPEPLNGIATSGIALSDIGAGRLRRAKDRKATGESMLTKSNTNSEDSEHVRCRVKSIKPRQAKSNVVDDGLYLVKPLVIKAVPKRHIQCEDNGKPEY